MESDKLPNGWHMATLAEIARQDGYGLVDGPFGSNLPASAYVPSGIPVIRGSNLSLGNTRFRDDEFVFVSDETAKRLSSSLCSINDIIFTEKGTLGQIGIIPAQSRYPMFLLSSNQMKLSVDQKIANPQFVYYYISSPASRAKIIRDSEATGVPKTNLAYLRTFPILLPPLSEQHSIAHILGTLDDKIDLMHINSMKQRWSGDLYRQRNSCTCFTSIGFLISRINPKSSLWRQFSPISAMPGNMIQTMRIRLSAAYKGVNALLMKEGAQDFRSGQKFDHTVFFGENVDIHHIFPQDWCKKHSIKPSVFDSIINKTPLSYKTNRISGGVVPSKYLAKLERGDETTTPPIDRARLDAYLTSHLIDPLLLRTDNFDTFMMARQKRLLTLIEEAIGKTIYRGDVKEEGEDAEVDEDTVEAELTISTV